MPATYKDVHSSTTQHDRDLWQVPLLTCRISILHQFEPCAHAFDWQVGVHGVLLSFSDATGRRFSATYLPEVALEHGMTREVAIRELVAKSGYAGPCQARERPSGAEHGQFGQGNRCRAWILDGFLSLRDYS